MPKPLSARRFLTEDVQNIEIAVSGQRILVDPVTVIAVLAAAKEVLDVINDIIGKINIKKQLAQINGKLDLILANQIEMISAIHRLGVQISKEFQERDIKELNSLKQQIPGLIENGISDDEIGDVQDLTRRLVTITGVLGQYGPDVMVSYIGSVVAAVTFMQASKWSRSRRLAMHQAFQEPLARWLSVDVDDGTSSLPALINATDALIAGGMVRLEQHPREFDVGEVRYRDTDGRSCYYRRILVVTGDFSSGFEGTFKSRDHRCSGRSGPGGNPNSPFVPEDDLQDLAAKLDALPQEQGGGTGFADLDNIRAIRNEIIRHMAIKAQLELLAKTLLDFEAKFRVLTARLEKPR